MKTPSQSEPRDFQIKHFLPKSCPVSGGGKLIVVCGNVPKSKAKVCLQVFDVYDNVKWSKEFVPGKSLDIISHWVIFSNLLRHSTPRCVSL